MKIKKSELATKLNKVKGIVPKQTQLKVLQGVLVKDGYLIANNMELTIKAKLEGTENECFIIPERAFDLINNLPDGEIEITIEDNAIVIQIGNIRNKYQTMEAVQFPIPATIENESQLTINTNVFLESIRRVAYAISQHGSNAIMESMCLQAREGRLNFVGLNGHVLAWDNVEYEHNDEFELLIPRTAIDKLKNIGLTGNIKIQHTKTGAVFINDDFEIYTRLVEGKYFKYKEMFKDLPLHTVVSRMNLLDSMTRAKMCTEGKRPVEFEFEKNLLNIKIKDSVTDYQEMVNLEEDISETLTIWFDAKLVLETIKSFDCENVGVSLHSSKMPMIIEAEDSDFKTMILPVAVSPTKK